MWVQLIIYFTKWLKNLLQYYTYLLFWGFFFRSRSTQVSSNLRKRVSLKYLWLLWSVSTRIWAGKSKTYPEICRLSCSNFCSCVPFCFSFATWSRVAVRNIKTLEKWPSLSFLSHCSSGGQTWLILDLAEIGNVSFAVAC